MGEKGLVIDLKDNEKIAIVSFKRTEACAKCKACMAGFSEQQMILEVKNDLGAKVGNTVLIDLPEGGLMTASLILYVIPFAAMISGFIAGFCFANIVGLPNELISFLSGLVFLAVSLVIIHLNENRFKTRTIFHPYVSEVVSDSPDEVIPEN